MIEELIERIYKERQHKWKIDNKMVVPTENDIMLALDEVARLLHTEEPGTRLDIGGLIVDKTYRGHDVYVYVGSYQ
jgi:hypothetical protein